MKKDKWLKWKIALVSTAGMAVMFHIVKASPAFEAAKAANNTLNNSSAETQQNGDAVFDEWQRSGSDDSGQLGETPDSSSENVGPAFSEHGGRGWHGRHGGSSSTQDGSSGMQSGGGSGSSGTQDFPSSQNGSDFSGSQDGSGFSSSTGRS